MTERELFTVCSIYNEGGSEGGSEGVWILKLNTAIITRRV